MCKLERWWGKPQLMAMVGQTSADGDGGANLRSARESLSLGKSHICGLTLGESHTDNMGEILGHIIGRFDDEDVANLKGWEL